MAKAVRFYHTGEPDVLKYEWLLGAFQTIPLICLASAAAFLFARRHYAADLERSQASAAASLDDAA
jgi:hypothetical protein